MTKIDKNSGIRYGFGKLSFNTVLTHEDLLHGLKDGNGVVIIHPDDFLKLLRHTTEFFEFKSNFYDIMDVLQSWTK